MLPDVPGPAGPGGLDNAPLGVILRTDVAPIPVRIPAPNSVRTSTGALQTKARLSVPFGTSDQSSGAETSSRAASVGSSRGQP